MPPQNKYKRILIIRTDRIGDVVLTTPMIKAIKDAWPQAYVAIMISPSVLDIVQGNPYLDEVIVYDKNNSQRGFWRNFKFIINLAKKKFDLAVVLHTKNRMNIIAWLAGIKERVGYYNKKCSLLLTKKLVDSRAQGLKHESEYCLDILRALGIETKDTALFMPINNEAEKWAEFVLKENDFQKGDLVIAVHPGASCPSKRWPIERFAQLASILSKKYNAKIVLVGSQDTLSLAEYIFKQTDHRVLNLTGKLTIAKLAGILRRSKLLISNDSGPVHIAVSVGTPVVAIFGRNEPGLSPTRWGPLGEKSVVLHKQVGCKICHAHNCKIGFACLKAVTIEEVLEAIDKIVKV